jgi:hypothetical protein
MPFSKHHIDPAHIEAMRAAFYRICNTLLLKCDRDDPMTEVIADMIVALGKAGEHDANRLAELVLNDLAAPAGTSSSRTARIGTSVRGLAR